MSRKIRRAKRAIWLMLKRFMVSAFPLAWTGGAGYRSSNFRILSQIRPPERSNLATAGNRPGAPSWPGASHECGPFAGRKSAMRHKGSVGLIMTQLATDELVSPRDEGYRDMIAVSLAGRAGNPDAVGQLFVPVRVCQLKQASSSQDDSHASYCR